MDGKTYEEKQREKERAQRLFEEDSPKKVNN